MTMGRLEGDDNTNVVEEGAIGDESVEGLVSVRKRQVEIYNGQGGVAGGRDEVSETG